MGWTDEEIDNLYKNASNQQSVGYSDAYWKEMEELLDAEKPARKRGFVWWYFGTALIVVAMGSSYYFVTTNGTDQQIKTSVAQNNHLPVTISETEKNNPISDSQVNAETSTVSGGPVMVQSVMRPVRTTKKSANSASEKTQAPVRKEHNPGVKEEILAINATGVSSVKGNRDASELTVFNQEKPLLALESPEHNEKIISSEDLTNEKQEQEQEITPLIEEVAVVNAVDVDELLLKKKIGFYVAADAGAGTSYLRQPTNLYIQWGVKAGVDYTIRNRFRLGGGLGFRQQMLNDLTVQWSREYYSLGLISVNQSVTYDQLQFVDLNIHAHYVFRKFAVGVDVSPSYLISARAKMDQTQEENGKPVDGSMTHTTEKQYVRSDNFNAFGLDAGVSFQYQFKHQMLLELGVGARINKLLMNTNFNGEHNKLPLRLELGFVKRF